MRRLTHIANLARALIRPRAPRAECGLDVNLWCRGSTLLALRARQDGR